MAKSTHTKKKVMNLLDMLERRSSSSGRVSSAIYVEASNRALAANPLEDEADASDFYKEIERKVEDLLLFGKLLKKIERAEKIANQIAPRSLAVSKGSGAISSSEVWARLGWELTPSGFRWNRPPSMRLKEHVPPTGIVRYVANYDAVESSLDDSEFYPPVTKTTAAVFRKEDAAKAKRLKEYLAEKKAREKEAEARRRAKEKYDNALIRARESAWFRLEDYRVQDLEENDRFLRKQRKEEAEDRRLRESRRSIAVRRAQINAYKQFPWVKSLVDAGIIQKKELPKISKILLKSSSIPIIGRMARNPSVAFAAALTGLIAMINRSVYAAGKVLPWHNLETAGGSVTDAYKHLMASAGLSEREAISSATKRRKLVSGWTKGFGLDAFSKGAFFGITPTASMLHMSHDQLLDYVSRQAYGIRDHGDRLSALAAYGINEAEYTASIQRQGLTKRPTSSYISQAAQRAKDRKARAVSEGKWLYNLTHPDWLIDFISAAMPNDVLHGKEWRKMLDEELKSREAAESAEEYERTRETHRQYKDGKNEASSRQVSFNINEVRVEANNYEEFIHSIASEAGIGYNIDVVKWADSRRIKV